MGSNDNTRWATRAEHASGLVNFVRLLLSLAGVIGIAIGIFAILKNPPAEAGGTAILVGSILLLLLAVAGRFPDRLSGAGWEVEFRPSTIQEVLSLVQTGAPELSAKVEELLKSGARDSESTAKILRSVDKSREEDASFETRARDAVKKLRGIAQLKENVTITVPSPGRPPLLNMRGVLGGRNVVFEIKSTWTPAISDYINRRLVRALTASDVDAAVLVVPAAILTAASTEIVGPGIVVTSLEGLAEVPGRVAKV